MEESGSYVQQLRAVFDSCDTSGDGLLGRSELEVLCTKLQLESQVESLIQHLLGESESKVDFEDFKEGFISLLAQSVEDLGLSEEESANSTFHCCDEPAAAAPAITNAISPSSVEEIGFANEESFSVQRDLKLPEILQGAISSGAASENVPRKRQRVCSRDSAQSGDEQQLPKATIGPDKFRDYLQSVWRNLGIGQDGFLDEKELRVILDFIGMDNMSEQVITELFEKLGVDKDGKICVSQFLDLVQSGSSITGRQIKAHSTQYHELTRDRGPIGKFVRIVSSAQKDEASKICDAPESGIFSSIDSEGSGFADSETVLELFDSIGIDDGRRIMRDLGFSASCLVPLQELTEVLDDALQSSHDPRGVQIASACYRHEVYYLRAMLEQTRCERNKLRADLEDANSRVALLAQEVDEHQARTEKVAQNKIMCFERQYQEQMRGVQERLESEQEALHCQMARLKRTLDEERRQVKAEEQKLRERMQTVQEENTRLEKESREQIDELTELNRILGHQHKELAELKELRQRVAELESGCELHLDQNLKTLSLELEASQTENKNLKDRNDELETQLSSLRLMRNKKQDPSAASCVSSSRVHRAASWLSDYDAARRRSDRFATSSPDENSEEESPRLEKVGRKLVPTCPFEGSGTEADDDSSEVGSDLRHFDETSRGNELANATKRITMEEDRGITTTESHFPNSQQAAAAADSLMVRKSVRELKRKVYVLREEFEDYARRRRKDQSASEVGQRCPRALESSSLHEGRCDKNMMAGGDGISCVAGHHAQQHPTATSSSTDHPSSCDMESALLQQLMNMLQSYKEIEKHHLEEVSYLHTRLTNAKDLLARQGSNLLVQLEKTGRCNLLLNELYADNARLTSELWSTKSQINKLSAEHQHLQDAYDKLKKLVLQKA